MRETHHDGEAFVDLLRQAELQSFGGVDVHCVGAGVSTEPAQGGHLRVDLQLANRRQKTTGWGQGIKKLCNRNVK